VTFFCAQLAFVGSAVEDLGSVTGDMPFGRVVAVEVANSFSSLAVVPQCLPQVRFFQQQGYDASLAVSSSVVVTSVSWAIKGLLFAISLPLAWGHPPQRPP